MYTKTLAFSLLILLPAFSGLVAQQTQTPPAGQPGQTPRTPLSIADIKKALGPTMVVTATISAIDYDDKVVVLRDEKGTDHAMYLSDQVKKLGNVKAGDTVTITYYTSLASRILKPGEASQAGTKETVSRSPDPTKLSTTDATEQRWIVTVNEVNLTDQTVTVTGEKGRVYTFRADDKSKISAIKPGDRVEVLFTAAVVVDVKPQ